MKETIVLYFFQGEAGESISQPNAFVISSAGPVTMTDFLDAFPVKNSALHYRFQMDDKMYGYTWKDITSPSDVLPTHMGIIMAKILRLDPENCVKRKTRLCRKTDIEYCESGDLAPAPVQANKRDDLKPNVRTQRPAASRESSHPSNSFDKSSGEGSPTDTTSKPERGSSPAVERSSPPPAPKSTPTPPINSTPSPPPPPPEPALSREELAARREANVQDQVDEALREKRERDESQRKEEEELEAARAKYDKMLTAWAMDNNKRRNVRTLLSTMHTVIWPDSRWKPIGLGDVIAPNQVKLAYRKAMLVVHTDRCSGLDIEKKFIGKRIFENINEAYREFLEKEDV